MDEKRIEDIELMLKLLLVKTNRILNKIDLYENGNSSDDDSLYDEALAVVVKEGKASVDALQRKLQIGYARAARLMDIFEERGVIGPADGNKPRVILLDNK